MLDERRTLRDVGRQAFAMTLELDDGRPLAGLIDWPPVAMRGERLDAVEVPVPLRVGEEHTARARPDGIEEPVE